MGGVTKNLKLYIERKMIDLGIYLLGFKKIVPNSRYNFFSTIFLNFSFIFKFEKNLKMLEKNPKIPIFKKLVFNIIYDFLKQKNRLPLVTSVRP